VFSYVTASLLYAEFKSILYSKSLDTVQNVKIKVTYKYNYDMQTKSLEFILNSLNTTGDWWTCKHILGILEAFENSFFEQL